MVSPTSRLVCRNRQWVGQVPKCEIKQNPNAGLCAEASCEHICNEINGRPVCSCYEGFRLDGRKCVGKHIISSVSAIVNGHVSAFVICKLWSTRNVNDDENEFVLRMF